MTHKEKKWFWCANWCKQKGILGFFAGIACAAAAGALLGIVLAVVMATAGV